VVPKVRRDDALGIATWSEALEAIENAAGGAAKVMILASAQMTNEEAYLAKKLADEMGASIDVIVDPIAPIRMKSRTEWLVGTQAGPNYRGVRAVIGDSNAVEKLLTSGADGIDVLFVCDAGFSERTKDPAVVANLRKAGFLIVQSWDATHPLTELADVLLPGTILAEKEGTFTNLQGRVQRIHQAHAPKGQAVTDLEVYRRIGATLFPRSIAFRSAEPAELPADLAQSVPSAAGAEPAETW
jgi:predicted molibdopterin-dependent oxidoreductase YjgC